MASELSKAFYISFCFNIWISPSTKLQQFPCLSGAIAIDFLFSCQRTISSLLLNLLWASNKQIRGAVWCGCAHNRNFIAWNSNQCKRCEYNKMKQICLAAWFTKVLTWTFHNLVDDRTLIEGLLKEQGFNHLGFDVSFLTLWSMLLIICFPVMPIKMTLT